MVAAFLANVYFFQRVEWRYSFDFYEENFLFYSSDAGKYSSVDDRREMLVYKNVGNLYG